MPNRADIMRSSNSRRSLLAFAAFLTAAALAMSCSASATTYRYTQIDVPGSYITVPYDINDKGQMVGLFEQLKYYPYGFLYTAGTFTSIAAFWEARGVNDRGQIVGTRTGPGASGFEGLLYSAGSFTSIKVPGSDATRASGINNAGYIVGIFSTGITRSFLDIGGNFTEVHVPGPANTVANGINDAGQIVGQFDRGRSVHGFLDTGGKFTQIDVPGASNTYAAGINDAGQIVGWFENSTGAHSFLDSGGDFTQLDVPGAISTVANGINNSGQIVGNFSTRSDAFDQTHGFLATPDGSVVGDPWFTTFDGRKYEFQKPGEYVLSRSTRDGDPFEVQIRSRPWRAGAHKSIVSAVAFELCDHRASFDIDRTGPGDGLIQVDGLSSSLSVGAPLLLGGCKILQLSANQYEAVWDTGELVDITDRGPNLNVSSWYSPFLGAGSVEGLLTTSDNPEQWRITDPTSLFDDPPAALDAAAAAPAPVPEPATLTLLAIGFVGLAVAPPYWRTRARRCEGD